MHHRILTSVFLLAFSVLTPAAAQTFMQRLACTGDAVRLCRGYVPNHRLVANCMELKHDQLSPRCMAVFDAGMDELRAEGRAIPAR